MSLYVTGALPRLAFAIADTRVVGPAGAEDGHRKLAPFPAGWVTCGMVSRATKHLADLLACRTTADMHAALLRSRATVEAALASLPESWRKHAARGPAFQVAEPGRLFRVNTSDFSLVELGPPVQICLPIGCDDVELTDLVLRYREDLTRCFADLSVPPRWPEVRALVAVTAALVAALHDRTVASGNVSREFELGLVLPAPSGALEWWHVGPSLPTEAWADRLMPVLPGALRFGPILKQSAAAGGGAAAGPSAPPNTPSTTNVGATAATANWVSGDNSPGVTTIVEYKRTADSTWIVAAEVDVAVTSYQLNGLVSNVQYHLRAKNRRNGQDSTYLGPVAGTTFTTIATLLPPTNCDAQAFPDQQVLRDLPRADHVDELGRVGRLDRGALRRPDRLAAGIRDAAARGDGWARGFELQHGHAGLG
jgi:hypothetical protein